MLVDPAANCIEGWLFLFIGVIFLMMIVFFRLSLTLPDFMLRSVSAPENFVWCGVDDSCVSCSLFTVLIISFISAVRRVLSCRVLLRASMLF